MDDDDDSNTLQLDGTKVAIEFAQDEDSPRQEKDEASARQEIDLVLSDDEEEERYSEYDDRRPTPIPFSISAADWIDDGNRQKKLSFENQIFVYDRPGQAPQSKYYVCYFYKRSQYSAGGKNKISIIFLRASLMKGGGRGRSRKSCKRWYRYRPGKSRNLGIAPPPARERPATPLNITFIV